MSEHRQRKALAESLQDVIDNPGRDAADHRAEGEAARAAARLRRKRGVLGVLILGWGTLAWMWIAKPDAIFNPSLGIPIAAPQATEEALRYGIYLQAARIREFAAAHGRLPATIAEAGEVEEGLRYVVEGTAWTLRAMFKDLPLELTSQMSADSFLSGTTSQPQR